MIVLLIIGIFILYSILAGTFHFILDKFKICNDEDATIIMSIFWPACSPVVLLIIIAMCTDNILENITKNKKWNIK